MLHDYAGYCLSLHHKEHRELKCGFKFKFSPEEDSGLAFKTNAQEKASHSPH